MRLVGPVQLAGRVAGGFLDRVLPVIESIAVEVLDRTLERLTTDVTAEQRRVYIDADGNRLAPPRRAPTRLS